MRFLPIVNFSPRTQREEKGGLRQPPLAVFAMVLSMTSPVISFAQTCGPHANLTELFKYSQFAERDANNRATCQYGDNGQTVIPGQLIRIEVSESHIERLEMSLMGFNDSAFVERLDDPDDPYAINNVLYLGCEVTFFSIDIAVELRLYRRPNEDDIVQLDFVGRDPANADMPWTPLEIEDDVLTLPGTNWSWGANTALTNLFGEHCALPVARYAVFALCEQANQSLDGADTPSLLTRETTPTLVGHSLGATTAQFIVSTGTDAHPACPRIDAFAFGSTGLDAADVASIGGVDVTLMSYASECDTIAQSPMFYRMVQPGHLFTMSNSSSHLLNAIQEDLCTCLRSHEQNRLVDWNEGQAVPPSNNDLCPQPRTGQMRRHRNR